MYCPHCMKKIPVSATMCPYCSQATHTHVAGMATLRVSCNPQPPLWMMIVQPVTYFIGYKVYISVDDQDYVLKSKKLQIDISVPAGAHLVRISSMSKRSAKALKYGGVATAVVGAVTGSGSAVYAGAAVEDLGNAFSDKGASIHFDANELMLINVKLAWDGTVEEDKE